MVPRAEWYHAKWDISATRRNLNARDAIPATLRMKQPCLDAIPAMPASSLRFAALRAVLRVRPASTNPQLDTKPVCCANPRFIPIPLARLVVMHALLRPRYGSPRRNNAPSAQQASTHRHHIAARTSPLDTNSTARRRWLANQDESKRKQACGLPVHRVPAEPTPTVRAPWCAYCALLDPPPPSRRMGPIVSTVAMDTLLTLRRRSAPCVPWATIALPIHRCYAEHAIPATLPTSLACLLVLHAELENIHRRELRPRVHRVLQARIRHLQPRHSARRVRHLMSHSPQEPRRVRLAQWGHSLIPRPRAHRVRRQRIVRLA